MMWVSHETIYQALFVQGRGELRRERPVPADGTPGPASSAEHAEPWPDRRHGVISERPAEATDRAVPGHWEGDLIIVKDCKSAVGTLVERSTRYVLLLHLSDGRHATEVDQAMRGAIKTLPGELFRTLTWDQGRPWPREWWEMRALA